jgi:hypothetical protein
MKLTRATISRLKPDKADAVYYDDDLPGFGIRIREGGSRNYVVRYRLGGLERRHTIGSVAVLSVEDARKKARRALALVDDGRFPPRRAIARR